MLKPALAGAAAALVSPSLAFAADAAASGQIDLTSILNTAIAGALTIVGAVAVALVNTHVKDTRAAAVLDNAINNSLGAAQQAAQSQIATVTPHITLPGVTAGVAPALQYVLDHAGAEAARLGITPERIAEKISAKIGLANIATNLAVTASPSPAVVPPMAAVPAPPKD